MILNTKSRGFKKVPTEKKFSLSNPLFSNYEFNLIITNKFIFVRTFFLNCKMT